MAIWRYENAGTTDLLINCAGTTLTDLPATQSKTGKAFWGYTSGSTPADQINTPAGIKEIWIKVDMYLSSSLSNGNRFSFGHYSAALGGYVGVWNHSGYASRFLVDSEPTTAINTGITGTKGQINKVLLHMVSASSGGKIELKVNGTTYTYTGNVNNGADFNCLYFYSNSAKVLFSNIIASNAPVGIDEDVTPIGFRYTWNFDTEIIIRNPPLEWRYENYGTADLLSVDGTTLTDLPAAQSKTGSAFYQTSRAKCFDIPATKEIWIKFDVYSKLNTKWRVYNDSYGGAGNYSGICSQSNGDLSVCATGAIIDNVANTVKAQLQTYLLHMVSDSSGGVVEAWLDSVKLYTYIGNVNSGEDFVDIFLQSDGAGTFFSNVIISNVPLSFDDNVSSGVRIDLNFDTCRNIVKTVTNNFDTLRDVKKTVHVDFDTARDLRQVFYFDTLRNVKKTVNIDFDTERRIKKPVTVNFDTERIITNSIWRYENYGTADLLTVQGTTLTDLPATQSKTGNAFYQTQPVKCFDIPPTKEIWAKFDVYNDTSFSDIINRWYVYHMSTNDDVWGITAQTNGYLVMWAGSYAKSLVRLDGTRARTYLLHMVSGRSAGVVEVWLDGEKLHTYTGNVNGGADFDNFFMQSLGANSFFSNVIISSVQIGLDEDVEPIGYRYTWNFDTLRNVRKSFEIDFDTLRILTQAQVVNIAFDTLVIVKKSVNNNFDTSRNVKKSVSNVFDTYVNIVRSVRKDFDTARTLMHKIIMTPAQDGILCSDSDDNTDLQAISIDIATQQITDQLSFTSYRDFDILEQVKGQYLDYHFTLRVENTTERGIFVTCNCCSDIDDLLYSQIAYKIPRRYWKNGVYQVIGNQVKMVKKPQGNASRHIQVIANKLGLNTVLQFEDFISTVDIEQEGVTYQDLISEIFGWSARIPHKIINCFIRDGTLYVIQRGHEQNSIDLTNCHIEKKPVKRKSLVRTTWATTQTTINYRTADVVKPILGNAVPPEVTYEEPDEISRILPEQVVTEEDGIKTTIKYSYDNDGDIIRTETTTEGGDYDTKVVVINEYKIFGDKKRIVKERTKEYEKGDDSGGDIIYGTGEWVEVDSKVITHTYTQQGQQHVLGSDSEGGINGSITTPARHDDRPTPYDDKKSTADYEVVGYTYVDGKRYEVTGWKNTAEDTTLPGIALFDSSFPVEGYQKLQEITNDIKWLNRKTQEILTVNVFGLAHVVDLNDAIFYKGAKYFLDNNHAEKNNRIINKQSLQLVRWY